MNVESVKLKKKKKVYGLLSEHSSFSAGESPPARQNICSRIHDLLRGEVDGFVSVNPFHNAVDFNITGIMITGFLLFNLDVCLRVMTIKAILILSWQFPDLLQTWRDCAGLSALKHMRCDSWTFARWMTTWRSCQIGSAEWAIKCKDEDDQWDLKQME